MDEITCPMCRGYGVVEGEECTELCTECMGIGAIEIEEGEGYEF